MDTQALRQKILDLAIRGKLVPQDPNDEPASVLLERIRTEKQQMVKEGKLKPKDIKNDTIIFRGEDNLHYEKFQDGTVKCIEDEIPFDVPEGWGWSRLGSICIDVLYGLSNSAESSGTHKLLRITDIQDGKVNWSSVPFTTIEDKKDYLLKNDDIVFARTGATVGKSFLIKDAPVNSVYASYLIRIRLNDKLDPEYIYAFFNSGCYWAQITEKSIGVGQPNCNGTSLRELFVPIPPASQQPIIAAFANKSLSISNIIENKQASLHEIITQCKVKILDLAIRGKLVPQDSNDEPAYVLLERIRAEKEKLIKQGKIKRDKNESVIFKGDDNSYYEKLSDGTQICIDEEIPFEVPNGWEWTRLNSLAQYRKGPFGSSLTKAMFISESPTAVKVYEQKNAINKNVNLGTYYISEEKYESMKSFEIFPNDIIVSCAGTIGETFVMPPNMRKGIINQALMKISLYDLSIMQFYLVYFDFVLKNMAKEQGYGNALKNIPPFDVLKNYLIPIPPISEQKVIISKINDSFATLDPIEQSLN